MNIYSILKRIYFLFFFCAVLLSCGKDENISYPKSYTFSSVDQSDEGHYLVLSSTSTSALPVTTGSYGMFIEDLKLEVKETIEYIFDLKEIELLSEDMVRIHIVIEDEVLDTIVTYTMEDKEIIIEALEGSNLISYNSDHDQFEVCSITKFAIPGPNVINPGQQYNFFNASECLDDHSLEDYLQDMLDEFNYVAQDTLGLFITRFIYK